MPHLSELFDESLFCSSGYTASESLRSSAYSVVSDLVHHVRKELSYEDLCKAIQYISKGIHDPSLNINLQHMCCKVLLSLMETIRKDVEIRNYIFYRKMIILIFYYFNKTFFNSMLHFFNKFFIFVDFFKIKYLAKLKF